MSPIMTIESVREEQRRHKSTIEWLHKFDETTLPPEVKTPFVESRVATVKSLEEHNLVLDKIVSLIEAGEIVVSLL